ncbi:MAG: YIP1 family protein [Acidobacteriota bacterium]|jgi:hypothetical protein
MSEANGTATEAATKGFLARVIGVFLSPGETFEDVRRRPTILLPMITLMLLLAAIFWVITPASTADQLAAAAQSPRFQNLPEEQQEAQLAFANSPAARIIGTVVPPIFILLFSLFFALIYWGAGHLLGGEPTYKGMLSMILFIGFLNPCLQFLVKAPLIVSKNTVMGVTFGPAMFLPDLQVTSMTYTALALLDIFNIWSTVVSGIGVAKVSKLSTGAGMAIAIVVFLIGAGIQLGFRAAFS